MQDVLTMYVFYANKLPYCRHISSIAVSVKIAKTCLPYCLHCSICCTI